MVPSRFEFVEPVRREMEITADRIWDRLRFVVIIQTGEIAPARVAAQFDETGPDHDAKAEPPKKPDDEKRWPTFRKWPRIEQRAEKDRQEASLEQLGFPAVAVPNLADVDDRHVHHPKNCQDDCIRVTGEHDERQSKTDPREAPQSTIGDAEPKECGQPNHSGGGRPELRLDSFQKMIRRRQAVFADQWHELLRRDQKCNCVNESKQSQNNKAREPIRISAGKKLPNKSVSDIHDVAENVQRSTPNVQRRMKRSARGES